MKTKKETETVPLRMSLQKLNTSNITKEFEIASAGMAIFGPQLTA